MTAIGTKIVKGLEDFNDALENQRRLEDVAIIAFFGGDIGLDESQRIAAIRLLAKDVLHDLTKKLSLNEIRERAAMIIQEAW